MKKRVMGGLGLAGLAGTVHGLARRQATRITTLPDPYAAQDLSAEPTGEDVLILRPDGTRLRARVAGTGPTVVLVHGYGVTLAEWNVVWERLRGEYRLIAYDHRGHGQSSIGALGVSSAVMAADLGAVLDFFEVKDATLLSHSMGGFLSLIYLLDHPEAARGHISRAVIVASFAGDVANGAPQTRAQIPLIRSGIMPALARTHTYGWALMAPMFGKRPFASGVEAMRRMFAAQRHGPLMPVLRALQDENYYPRLNELQLPVTILCGTDDATTPRHHAEQLAAGIDGARLTLVPDMGHALNWEAPDAIVAAVRA